MKTISALTILLLVVFLGGCSRSQKATADGDRTVKFITSDAGFNSEIVPILRREMAAQGFTLDWIVVNDIIQPNKLVDDGSADANSFQHEPYFDQFVADHGLTNIVRGFYTVFSPSGLYSKKYKSLGQVPDGATFGIPVDPANNRRALFMLQDKGLLRLKSGVSVTHASQRERSPSGVARHRPGAGPDLLHAGHHDSAGGSVRNPVGNAALPDAARLDRESAPLVHRSPWSGAAASGISRFATATTAMKPMSWSSPSS
jgi:hypothetical protein